MKRMKTDQKRVLILFTGRCARNGVEPENCLDRLVCAVHITLTLGLRVNRRLYGVDLKITEGF